MLGWMDDEALAPHPRPPGGRPTGAARAGSTGSRARPPATTSASRRSASTATATPCWSRSTRRARPATPATAPASTPTCCWPPMAERRRTFGPILALGAGGSGAGRGRRDQGLGDVRRGRAPRPWTPPPVARPARCPLATALALVVLAAWGVVLVTRGRVRRAVAVLGAAGRVGVLATVVSGWWLVPQTAARRRRRRWASTPSPSTSAGWFWVALVGAVLSAVAHGAGGLPGRRLARDGQPVRRPGRAGRRRRAAEEPSHLDLWKSLDHGQRPRLSRLVPRSVVPRPQEPRCPRATATPPQPGPPSRSR